MRDLDALEQALGLNLPADFKHFQMSVGSGCTMKPLPYIRFYAPQELSSLQSALPPQALEFATDDASGYAFDISSNRSSATYSVITYPLSSQDRAEAEFAAQQFREFLERLLMHLQPLRPL